MALALHTAIYAVLATTGLILLRSSLEGATFAEGLRMPGVYLGAACYAASFGTFVAALRHFGVLTVFPLFSGVRTRPSQSRPPPFWAKTSARAAYSGWARWRSA